MLQAFEILLVETLRPKGAAYSLTPPIVNPLTK